MDSLQDFLITFGPHTLFTPGDRMEGEAMELATEYAVSSQSLCGAADADVRSGKNRSGSFELVTVQTFKTHREAVLALMEHEAEWEGADEIDTLKLLSTRSTIARKAGITNRTPSIVNFTKLRIAYSFILSKYVPHR